MFEPSEAIRAYTNELDVSWIRGDVQLIGSDGVRLIRSVLVSADRDLDPAEIPFLRETYHAVAADWESGAIAHVCRRNNVPVTILRGVSDLVSVHNGEAYDVAGLFRQRTEVVMRTSEDFSGDSDNVSSA
jgi:adenosylhomocysteine nucleosidase